jgi:uncharacterized protein (DUF1499 family)
MTPQWFTWISEMIFYYDDDYNVFKQRIQSRLDSSIIMQNKARLHNCKHESRVDSEKMLSP